MVISRETPRCNYELGVTVKKTMTRSRIFIAAAVVAVLAIGPATAANAAQKDFAYNCATWDALTLKSKGLHTVGHYRNGALVASWNNGTVAAWRSTNPNPAAGTASVYASYALYGSEAYCVRYA